MPRDLETICLKCLEKSPARRYPDARELADDLRRFLDGEPIRARPLGMAGKAVRWARRRPAVAGLLAAVVLSLTAGFVLVSGQWLRANREWSRAEEKAEAEKKAKGEAEAAGAEAKEARRRAEERQAHLALTRGRTLCEQGEIDQGLLWLARALELSETAAATALDRPLRVTLADWARQLPRLQFEVRTPKECRTLAFVPQSGLLAATGNDGRVHFWNAASGKKDGKPLDVYGLLELHPQVWNLAFSRDGKTALTGGSEGRAALWDVAARRRLHDLPHPPGKKDDVNVWGTGLSPDGRLAATGVTGGFARLWDVATGRPVGDPLRHGDAHDTVFAVAFSTNGQELYTASRDSRLRRWAAPTGERVEPPLVHESLVEVIACSPDGRTVLTGTREGAVRLWDTRTWQAHRLPPQGAGVIAAAFSPDGSLFATGTRGGWVRLWDAAYRLPVGPVWRQDGPVSGVAFSPDGQALAIGEEVGTIRVWALPRLNTLGSLAADHRVQDVAFDRAGHALLMAGPLGACLRDGAAGRFPPGGRPP